MQIERKRLEELTRADYNPRVNLEPGDYEYENLFNSIEEFGYVVPIIWNKRTGNIVGGHQRLTVLMNSGVEEAEVSVVDLDIEQEKQLNVALNRIEGRWDNNMLRDLLNELDEEGLAESTGFDRREIDFMNRTIDDLIDNEVVEAEREGIEETFNLTLTFDSAYRDEIEGYARENGKEGMIQLIIQKAKGEI